MNKIIQVNLFWPMLHFCMCGQIKSDMLIEWYLYLKTAQS